MLIGVPKEIKNHEYRVGMAPASVREAIKHGHQVMVECKAGDGIGVSDAEYQAIGAETVHQRPDDGSSVDPAALGLVQQMPRDLAHHVGAGGQRVEQVGVVGEGDEATVIDQDGGVRVAGRGPGHVAQLGGEDAHGHDQAGFDRG